jgi:hypothetical protein
MTFGANIAKIILKGIMLKKEGGKMKTICVGLFQIGNINKHVIVPPFYRNTVSKYQNTRLIH